MAEREGTAADFAALFGGGSSKADNQDVVAAIHPDEDAAQTSAPTEGDGLTSNQQRAANEFRLPNAVAERLRGDDWEAVATDAQAIVDAFKKQEEASEPEHVKLAKAAILAAESNPNRAELLALSRVKPAHAAINALLEEKDGE